MKKVLFSILVHEQPKVIIDQILNIQAFVKDPIIVLHFNKEFISENEEYDHEKFVKELTTFKNVYVNSERLIIKWGDIIQGHLSNFEYMNKIGVEYDIFYFVASNMMFIRKGLENITENYDICCGITPIPEKDTFYPNAKKDECLKQICTSLGTDVIYKSQIEGSFYEKSVFSKVCNMINEYYDYTFPHDIYPREEVYFSTIALAIKSDKKIYTIPNCYMMWNLFLQTRLEDIIYVRKKKSTYYSIKRIERIPHDFFREYIRRKLGKYQKKYEQITNDKEKKYSDFAFLAAYLKEPLRKFKKRLRNLKIKVKRLFNKEKK